MAEAAVNMLTRTSTQQMFETDGILMTSVDTGWITGERPTRQRCGWPRRALPAPLDLVDGAAPVYDPVARCEAGEDVFGVILLGTAEGATGNSDLALTSQCWAPMSRLRKEPQLRNSNRRFLTICSFHVEPWAPRDRGTCSCPCVEQ